MTTLVDHYTLEHAIRETSSAVLYRGHRTSDRTPVLIKALRGEYPGPEEVAKLRYEYSILRSLAAPGVVNALALEESGNGVALILEDAGPHSLDTLGRSQPVDVPAFLRTAITLASIVESIHAAGVIHKDIKPAHFFVATSGAITLIDFAVATRLSHEDQRSGSSTGVAGTLEYISPEQTGRMNRSLDRRTDLYSLGVTLYELLTGQLPFTTRDPVELVHSHIARTAASPHQVLPSVPVVLSDIVMRLLAKVAEERYQNAAGLRSDLETCLGQLESTGRLIAFPLGAHDVSLELLIPQKLYGREVESATLLATFERARQGAVELFLVSGYSGIGKSALVNEIHRRIVRGGHFIAGKFDPLNRSVPYAPIAQACRALVREILAASPANLAVYRGKIAAALGPHGQVLVDLVPELELVIGPQPRVQELGPGESQHRFELVFQNFLQVFTTAAHPLAFFLDDLQWADPASLRLIHVMLTAPGRGHLLVIGAYRDNEVGPIHPLTLALEDFRKAGVCIGETKLRPLDLGNVTRLLADALGGDPHRLEPLAALARRKTDGNPFFLNQFLTSLARDGLLYVDLHTHVWTWDVARIERAVVTDNVATFLASKLQRLPAHTQRVLRLAACIGHEFDRQTLSVICEQSPDDVASDLWPALQEGLVEPRDDHSGYLHDRPRDPPDPARSHTSLEHMNTSYRFLHDRVQQAAYALIADSHRQDVHLRIGRLMTSRGGASPKNDELFEIANHMNIGSALITDPAERRALARLDLAAGRRARDAAAYGAAIQLLGHGLAMLGDDPWAADYDIAFPTSLTKAECESMTGNPDETFRLLEILERQARTTMDRLSGRELKLVTLTNLNRVEEAAACGADAVRLLGVEMPRDAAGMGPAVGAELAALQSELGGRNIEKLIDLPAMSDPAHLAVVNIFFKTCPAANQCNPSQMALMTLKAVRLALTEGNSPLSGYFYATYGMLRGIVAGDFDTGYRLGQLGIKLNERLHNDLVDGATAFVLGAFVSHWRKHISESIDFLRKSLKASLESGDYIHVGYACSNSVSYRFFRGDHLGELRADIQGVTELLARTGDVINLQHVLLGRQAIANLQGSTPGRESFDGEGFDEAEFKRTFLKSGNLYFVGTYYLYKAMIACLDGNYEAALAAAETATANSIPAFFYVPEQRFYHALAVAGRLRSAAAEDREGLLDALGKDEVILHGWAQSAPGNHAPRHALVAAELAAARGAADQAIDQYDRAIALARESGFLQVQAMANELCAVFHLARGRRKVAAVYMSEAHYAYLCWGATAKARQIADAHPELLAQGPPSMGARHRDGTASAAAPTHAALEGDPIGLSGRLDLATAVRASQAIAGELVLDKLIERLMRILVESAGARRGFLVIARDDRLEIAAEITVDPDTVRLGLADDVQTCSVLPATVVQYVARTTEALVLSDAANDVRFAGDPYVLRARPKSLLCVAMQHQGRLAGVLYFENDLATDAFSPASIELLEFLAGQAAIALENAKLYGEVRAATDQLRRANETLEAQVAQRTDELSRTLADLWSEMDLARKIQTVLLPDDLALPDYEVAAAMIPASTVGGDYYDVVRGSGSDWLLIGDVSGHGVTAGLIMMMVQTAARTIVTTSGDAESLTPAAVLSRVNAAVRGHLQRIGADQYMTLTALQVRGATIGYSGLHQDILVYRVSSGQVERIETRGVWIGLLDDISDLLEDRSFAMNDGDMLLLFTDGLTEMPVEGGRLGTEGLARAFQALASETRDVRAVVKGVLRSMEGRAVGDDVTLMAARYAPSKNDVR
jgi:predicted ATPase/serine phosphatase RsbU (regulator of sigma subunit)